MWNIFFENSQPQDLLLADNLHFFPQRAFLVFLSQIKKPGKINVLFCFFVVYKTKKIVSCLVLSTWLFFFVHLKSWAVIKQILNPQKKNFGQPNFQKVHLLQQSNSEFFHKKKVGPPTSKFFFTLSFKFNLLFFFLHFLRKIQRTDKKTIMDYQKFFWRFILLNLNTDSFFFFLSPLFGIYRGRKTETLFFFFFVKKTSPLHQILKVALGLICFEQLIPTSANCQFVFFVLNPKKFWKIALVAKSFFFVFGDLYTSFFMLRIEINKLLFVTWPSPGRKLLLPTGMASIEDRYDVCFPWGGGLVFLT